MLVAVLWGSTGPFLRTGAAGLEDVQCQGRLQQLLAEICFLGLNYKVRPQLGFWAREASWDHSFLLFSALSTFHLSEKLFMLCNISFTHL